MSLKARLEAVIYAAEEPVPLAQLAALFAADALEWKAAREAASLDGPDDPAAGPLPELNIELEHPPMEAVTEPPTYGASGAPETLPEPADAPAAAIEPPADLEVEQKRLARLRDREVRAILRGLLDELIAGYAGDDRGIEIREIAGGYRMATKPECHDAARMFVKSLKPALKLSLPALETLAVIAYKQPVTAPEVNEIRGVDSSGVFGSLLARKLIATAGRKQVIGRPILYKTTREFLLRFGLNDVSELPSMEEFEKIAQLEFEEMEPLSEPDAMASPTRDASEDFRLEEDGEARYGHSTEDAEPLHQEGIQLNETAAKADSEQAPPSPFPTEEPATTETHAEIPAYHAETIPAEAAPAAPSPLEQAETETVPHD